MVCELGGEKRVAVGVAGLHLSLWGVLGAAHVCCLWASPAAFSAFSSRPWSVINSAQSLASTARRPVKTNTCQFSLHTQPPSHRQRLHCVVSVAWVPAGNRAK